MRLLFCSSCEDVITLKKDITRSCSCGKVVGTIKDDYSESSLPEGFSFALSGERFVRLLIGEINLNVRKLNERFNEDDRGFCVKVLEYLNDRAGTDYKTKFPSTAATQILHRRKELDLIIDDFYKVIDKKCKDWLGTDYEKYLRPMTLFNKTKFENYLGELNGKQSNNTLGKTIGQFASAVQSAKK